MRKMLAPAPLLRTALGSLPTTTFIEYMHTQICSSIIVLFHNVCILYLVCVCRYYNGIIYNTIQKRTVTRKIEHASTGKFLAKLTVGKTKENKKQECSIATAAMAKITICEQRQWQCKIPFGKSWQTLGLHVVYTFTYYYTLMYYIINVFVNVLNFIYRKYMKYFHTDSCIALLFSLSTWS